MRRASIVLLLLSVASAAHAQTPSNATGLAYGFVGPGSVEGSTLLNLGGGAEVLYKGFGAGVELGMLAPTQAFTESYWGTLSLNGVYHFSVRPEHASGVSPFVTAGYTLFFRDGHVNLWNFGGGVDYWFSRRVGVRAEFRDHVYLSQCTGCSTTHFWNVRGGIVVK